jgi:GNAT superfamily N-acetyltransferase
MINELSTSHNPRILEIINNAAKVFKGLIPDDRWKEPYISAQELKKEIDDGVKFFGYKENTTILGVMGIQHIKDITLIRHAYVTPKYQNKGIGKKILKHLITLTKTTEILVGTWEDATWAINFYEKQGFLLVSKKEKDKLLRRYWKIPNRQIETSVVLKFKNK